ncbi:MAG: CotH kinase family protein [Oscillospiraceae bacterium]|nr:CotH kinase family protein [Oscillospiraceae bacterium]
MNHKRILAVLLCGCLLAGCSDSSTAGSSGEEQQESSTVRLAETVDAMQFTKAGVTQTPQRFLGDYSQLALTAPEGAEIYYTLDGSVPDKSAVLYTEPIVLEQLVGDFPQCCVLRAKAYFADGGESETATHTFWTAFDIASSFRNYVVSLVGDPAEITDKPDGIFYKENAKKRGRDSERAVSVEIVDSDGDLVLAQNASMRVFGAASRDASIKSVKLFARKSYDEAHGKFDLDLFGTADAEGSVIDGYDKLVLRNAGNDFQFAFIRDELNQTLAAEAGYTDCEGVMPVVVYLNGSYYGVHWMHESICDDLLKDKYGGKGAGKYVVLEGKEQEKNVPEDDEEEAAAAEEFNTAYAELSALDLTDDASYEKVCAFMDVPNYLRYFAFNIYVNNNDWPQNNMKIYRYYANDEADYSLEADARTDGRWRWWLHDTDYAEGLYEQTETQAQYNNLAEILKPGSDRYAPMFAALMQREDCRELFLGEMQRLMDGVLSPEHMGETLDRLNTDRYFEMIRYFTHLEELKKTDSSIWIWYQGFLDQQKIIRSFINARPEYMTKFLSEAFSSGEAETE